MSQGKSYGRRSNFDRQHRQPGGPRSRQKPVVGGKAREVLENLDSKSPVIALFLQYASALDSKHDRHERIVKISRDITIESKRIIFLLHTVDRESKKDAILQEAETRLNQLVASHFKDIAIELEGQDPYEYARAYSAGLQEFIEAATFHYYLKNKGLQHWNDIAKQLCYEMKQTEKNTTDDNKCLEKADIEKGEKDSAEKPGEEGSTRTIATLVQPSEYMLGVGDLTGELMRKCINNVGSGNIDGCYETCGFVKEIYNGFLGVGTAGPKTMKQKVHVLQQSLRKMENACYVIHVRGSEIPKEMLAHVFSGGQDEGQEEDEGFY